jgi:AcrR family transcriptional regulator
MRARILKTASTLLREQGREAVTTRAITSALHIQAPTIYRHFGDKQGLLDAVALHGFDSHLHTWTGWTAGADPVESLRQGWDMHVAWGLDNPHVYAIAYGEARKGSSPAADAIDAILRTQLEQVAAEGRLAVPVESAVRTLRAVGVGVVLTLLSQPPEARDPDLSARGRDAALAAVLAEQPPGDARTGAAMQLRQQLPDVESLTPNERALLADWLDRIASAPPPAGRPPGVEGV